MNIDLTVLVPFYNEEEFLNDSVKNLIDADFEKEIILIDDCSTDNSSKIAKLFVDNYKNVSYLRTNKNLGKGNALSFSKKYINTSHVIIHDADLEYSPDDIVEIYRFAKEYPNSLILGSRFKGSKVRNNLYLRTYIGNQVISIFFSVVNMYRITDVATCYKMFPSKFFKNVNFIEQGFSIEVELLSKFLKYNKSVFEVPIEYNGRSYFQGKKIKTIDGYYYLFNIIKYKLSKLNYEFT